MQGGRNRDKEPSYPHQSIKGGKTPAPQRGRNRPVNTENALKSPGKKSGRWVGGRSFLLNMIPGKKGTTPTKGEAGREREAKRTRPFIWSLFSSGDFSTTRMKGGSA